MTVALSSLRVTADMDSSAYTQGMAAKVAADMAGAASSDAVGQALARQDAALDKSVPGVSRLSKSLLDGYGAASTFERTVRSIGDAMDRGMGIDRANVLLDAAYRKFGLAADAATLAKQGYVALTPSVDALNQHYSVQAEILDRATQASLKNSAAMQAQQKYNALLGVSEPAPGAAKASADAFMAQYGGLEGLASAKAKQIGQSFQASLTQSLGIDAPTKSAKEAAAVFQEQFDNLDTIAKQRGEQMGENFQKTLNASFGIGAPSATSQGATYSALDEMMKQQEAVAQARAAQNATSSQQGLNDSFGIGAQAKSAKDSAAIFDEAMKKEDGLNAAAQRLRDTLDPMAAAQAKLNTQLASYQQLADAGKITTAELAAANDMAQKEFASTTNELGKFGAASIFGSTQGMALTAALRQIFDAVMAGRPPLQAVAMEMGNLEYAMSGLSSMGDTLKGIGSWIAALLTPLNVLLLLFGAFGALAAAAAFSWQSAQLAIATALTGIGKAAGATVADINQIADAHSSVSTISISAARNVAIALAETGKVSKETFGPIIDLTKNFAVTMGQSVGEAAKTLAGAFTDPVKGADDLNKRLGFLDDTTRKLIESLVTQGDRQGANKVLIDAMAPSLGRATDLTTGWAKAWNVVSNAVSDAFTKIGQFVSNEGPSLDAQIDALTKKLKDLQERGGGAGGQKIIPAAQAIRSGFASSDNSEIDATTKALKALQDQKDKLASDQADTVAKQFSLQIADLVKAAVPAGEQLRVLENDTAALAKAMADPSFAMYLSEINDLPQALARTASAHATVIDAVEKQIALQQLQLRAVDNRSPADRAGIASKQKELELAGQLVSAEERQTQIALAGSIASGGQTAQDNIYIQRVALLGNMATITEKVTAKTLELNNRAREGVEITSAQRQAILAQTQQQEEGFRLQEKITVGVATEEQIRQVMSNETIAFISRRRTLALSQADDSAYVAYQEKRIEKMIEQSKIAGSQLEGLKKLELDSGNFRLQVDTTSVAALNQMTTSIVDFTTGSKTGTVAFQDFGKAIIKMLEEMLVKMLIVMPIAKALQQTLSGIGGFGGVSSPTSNPYPGMAAGSNPTFHGGGMTNEPSGSRYLDPSVFANAPRFHTGIGPDELAAVIKKDEGVFTPGQMRAMGGAGAGANNVQVNVVNRADNTTTKTSKRKSNGADVTDIIISTVGSHMANGGFDAQLRARTGTQVKPRGR